MFYHWVKFAKKEYFYVIYNFEKGFFVDTFHGSVID